jgi:hypothetical protein
MSDKTSYEDNTEKEKYGIVGENFQNFSIADFKDPAFSCGLDRGFLIPRTETKALSFANKFLSNAKLNKKTISLNFTETPAISQNLASDKAVSVQPFLFGQFNGIVEMYPETDFWVENKLKPEVITVPERIIVEHTTVYKETVIERQPQITIEQIFPTRNVETIIIREPAVVPIPSTPDVVIVDNPPPPIIVQPDVPVEPPPPPPPPEPPPLPWEPPPPPPEPPTPIDLGSPPDPIWIPYDPPPVPPDPEPVVVTQPIAAGGGGCVVLESFIPLVESTIVNKREVKQAFQLISGFKISLGSENESLEPVIGTVVNNFVDVQPCVRIETESGISLVCSTTAPIYTKELEFVNAPDLMGRSVACMKDGATFWDKVVSVESVGDKFVNVIDAGGTAFWAGEKEDSYILHHNVKAWNRTDQGLEYDKK